MKNFGIYVHIPFCKSKCEYCSFISKCAQESDIQKYVNFLCQEIKLMACFYKNKKVSSIYIGGGTPSFISENHIKKILETIFNNYAVFKTAEISMECNPCSTTPEKLRVYKNAGVNRISFGVQSLCDEELKILGRTHNSAEALNAIQMAKQVGFKSVSADLMIGIPNQTKNSLIKSINGLINLGVNHISAYMLMLEEGTPIYNKVKLKELTVASDDECVCFYDSLVESLEKRGFNRYEISNFALKNYQCKHNINYWNVGEYLGFGLASHSYVNGARFENSENFEEYYKSVNKLETICSNNTTFKEINKNLAEITESLKDFYKHYNILTNKEKIEEAIMLGLRQANGVDITKLNKLGYNILAEKKEIINTLTKQKIIEITNNHIKLFQQHFGVCSAVVLELLP